MQEAVTTRHSLEWDALSDGFAQRKSYASPFSSGHDGLVESVCTKVESG
jgi:hypothetical protein